MKRLTMSVCIATVCVTITAHPQSVTWIPDRTVPTFGYARAVHISPNGRFVVGSYGDSGGLHTIFLYDRCQQQTTIVSQGSYRYAWYVSGDGQVIGGLTNGATVWENSSNGFIETRLASSGEVLGVSPMGDILIGYTGNPNVTGSPRVWKKSNQIWSEIVLPMNSELPYGIAFVGSPEGDLIVGHSYQTLGSGLHPTLWRREGDGYRIEILQQPSGYSFVEMFAASLYCDVLGGQLNQAYGYTWENGEYTIIQPLSTFSYTDVGDGYQTNGISPDGSVVVGRSFGGYSPERAIRWTKSEGTVDLMTRYQLDETQEQLRAGAASSLGGRYIVGRGFTYDNNWYPRAFILDTCGIQADINGDCCVDDADLLILLFDFGSTSLYTYADINCDGTVDDADLLILLLNFGSGC